MIRSTATHGGQGHVSRAAGLVAALAVHRARIIDACRAAWRRITKQGSQTASVDLSEDQLELLKGNESLFDKEGLVRRASRPLLCKPDDCTTVLEQQHLCASIRARAQVRPELRGSGAAGMYGLRMSR